MNNRKLFGGVLGICAVICVTVISVYHVIGRQCDPIDTCENKRNIPKNVYNLFCTTKRSTDKLPLDAQLENVLQRENVIPIVILGSGPAGLSAALYGARAKIRTLVIAGDRPGGQLMETTKIENWPGKRNVLAADAIIELRGQALSFGAEFLNVSIEKVDFTQWPYKLWTDGGKEINALAVIISTGASPRRLNIPGEEKFWGAGVTGCAICDAPFYKNKNVVVIGGGDSAVEEATILSSHAKEVTLLVRKDTMRAAAAMQKRLDKLPNVHVLYNREPREVLGNEKGVNGIKVLNNLTNRDEVLPIDGVFLAIGHTPNVSLFAPPLQLTKGGFIKLFGRSQETSIPGIFSAGDVSDSKYRQAGKAAGDGIAAGLDAIEFLNSIGYSPEISAALTRSTGDLFEDEESLVEPISSQQEFEAQVIQSEEPVAVFFGCQTCVSCPKVKRAFDLNSHRFEGRVKFFDVDADALPGVIEDSRAMVRKTPCILIYEKSKLLARQYDALDRFEMYDFIDQFL